MTALVPSSASAQATETDFDGLKVRSKPATGTAAGRAPSARRRRACRSPGRRRRPNMLLQVLLGDLRAGLDAPPAVEVGQAGAEEHPGRRAGGGVVAGQGVGALGRPVAGGHRLEQVAVSRRPG